VSYACLDVGLKILVFLFHLAKRKMGVLDRCPGLPLNLYDTLEYNIHFFLNLSFNLNFQRLLTTNYERQLYTILVRQVFQKSSASNH